MKKVLNMRAFTLGFSLALSAGFSGCAGSAPAGFQSVMALDVAPLLSIETPPVGAFITTANFEDFTLTGLCGYEGGTVSILSTIPISANVPCAGGAWAVTFDVSFLFDGIVTFDVSHTGPNGEVAPPVSRSYVKDTIGPSGASIVIGDGITPPQNPMVVLTLNASGATKMYITNTPGCASGGVEEPYAVNRGWVLQPVASIATVYAIYRDDAGNSTPCVRATTAVDFSVVVPTVGIVLPAAGSYVNLANQAAFIVSGICSENGQPVMISGSVAASTPCAAGVWSVSLNFSASPEGPIVVSANHRNAAGVPALTSNRSYIKDTLAPIGTIAINNGAVSTLSTSVVLALAAPGASEMYVTNVAGCIAGGVFEPFSANKAWVLGQMSGTATVYAAFRDAAGNLSACVSDAIEVVLPPLAISPASISLPSANANTVNFMASGGKGGYVFSLVSGPGAIVAATGVFTVPAGATGTTVVRVTDSAASTANATITYTVVNTWPNDCHNHHDCHYDRDHKKVKKHDCHRYCQKSCKYKKKEKRDDDGYDDDDHGDEKSHD